MIETERWREHAAVVLRNDELEAVVLPELGGKLASLRHLPSDTELLLPPVAPELRPRSGAEKEPAYTEADGWGFDECFPTVTGSPPFPDHGEIWSRPWEWESRGETVRMSVGGVHMRYAFERAVHLDGHRLTLDYAVRNRAARPLPCLWAAHPMLVVSENSRIVLPVGVDRLLVVSSSDPALGRGREIPWPEPGDGLVRRLDHVAPADTGLNLKGFTPRLDLLAGREGRDHATVHAGLQRPDVGLAVDLAFDASDIHYLGLWLCYGAVPDGWDRPVYTVSIEPSTGRGDSLTLAAARGHCEILSPGAAPRWSLTISVQSLES